MERVTDRAVDSVLAAGAVRDGRVDQDTSEIDGVAAFFAGAKVVVFEFVESASGAFG